MSWIVYAPGAENETEGVAELAPSPAGAGRFAGEVETSDHL
jgi:hypothetical protein